MACIEDPCKDKCIELCHKIPACVRSILVYVGMSNAFFQVHIKSQKSKFSFNLLRDDLGYVKINLSTLR